MSYTSGEIKKTVSGATVTLYYIKPQSPKNITLVNLTSAGSSADSYATRKGDFILTSPYFGMNASFFRSGGDGSGFNWNCLCNIAFQDGKTVGALDSGGENLAGCGTCVIFYNGSRIYYSSVAGEKDPIDKLIPNGKGTWAQGGMGLFLGYRDWEERFKQQYDTENEDYLEKANQRTAMVADVTTNQIYLFACSNDYHISAFRQAIMSYLNISEGSWESTPWAGIMLDGGTSMQMRTKDFYRASPFVKAVPQIISVT